MLVPAHSLGKSIFANGISPQNESKLNTYVPGEVLAPTLGDLTLLTNPASEAADCTGIQLRVRENGKMTGDNRFSNELFRLFPLS